MIKYDWKNSRLIKLSLIDFGFALKLKDSETYVQEYCGTPNYMAPEVLQKTSYEPGPADVWALGVMLYKMVVGKFPFINQSQITLTQSIMENNYIEP